MVDGALDETQKNEERGELGKTGILQEIESGYTI